MQKAWSIIKNRSCKKNIKSAGFLLVEVILASSIFVLLVTAFVGVYLYGQESTMLAGNRARATMLAEEGLEAVRNIRDADFVNLTNGTYGLTTTNHQWNLSGSQDVTDIFTRQIIISTIDTNRKLVTANVIWQQNPQRTGLVSLVTRFSNWQISITTITTCDEYAIQQGYESGICRQNTRQCSRYHETYLHDGDQYCVGSPSGDTCCARQ